MTEAAPPSPALQSFLKMLQAGKDNALVRFALGNEYLKAGDAAEAVVHFAQSVAHDANYTAAWKMYGKALAQLGRADDAIATYERGIEIAHAKGDRQAEKEMQVFLRRLRKPQA